MSGKDFEVVIIASQRTTKEIIDIIKDSGIDFKLVEERGFAPTSPEIAIQIITTIVQFLPIAVSLIKKIWDKKGYISFETRHRLARQMLVDIAPLYEIRGEDTKDRSYYEFKTAKCFHFWEFAKGEIRHGSIGGK